MMLPFGVLGAGEKFDPPGQTDFVTPGAANFTIPKYQNSLTIHLGGGGGGGAGAYLNFTYYGTAGGASTCGALGLSAGGGTNGGTGGVASGGTTNINGNNATGGLSSAGVGGNGAWPGAPGLGKGGNGDKDTYTAGGNDEQRTNATPGGGGGAYVSRTYSRGEISPGTILALVIGAGGTAGAQGGGAGVRGQISIVWN